MDSILSYCLENIPKSYDSTYLIDELTQGKRGSLEIKVLSSKYHRNILFLEAFALAFQTHIRIIIFNAHAYHVQAFKTQQNLYIVGTIEMQVDKMSHSPMPTLINPQITQKINTITAKFKKRGARLESIQSKITQDLLQDSGIPTKYIQPLYEIFYPTQDFFSQYVQAKGFPKQHIQALKFSEIFLYTQRLRKKKTSFQSKFQCHGTLTPFLENLPFTLTQAQQNAIATIQHDLQSDKSCRRIIMGDVGCGKTAVILASVMLAYPYKSVLMAPTTILAKQLYEEAKKYLPSSIKIACITSTTSKKEHAELLQSDFIIGTQALLFVKADFTDFALVMTDEQHRFGTNTRVQLEKMLEQTQKDSKKPHNLQFSATPIPRTMAMIQSNVIDFTFIKELPFKKDIQTSIINKSHFHHLISHIKDEIAKGHQIAIIYPHIQPQEETQTPKLFSTDSYQSYMDSGYSTANIPNQTIKSKKIPYATLKESEQYWLKNFDKVFSTHGKDKEKEAILETFAKTNGAILLATTMIEVGISLPQLSMIIIVGPERLGLASLHQLRGRVSRNGLKGYCYLYTHYIDNERLQRFSQTLSGFDIAELDLEYRNSGDLLDGRLQSGNHFTYFDILTDGEILQEANAIV